MSNRQRPTALLELSVVTDPTAEPFICPSCGAIDQAPATVPFLARVDVIHAHGCPWLRRRTT